MQNTLFNMEYNEINFTCHAVCKILACSPQSKYMMGLLLFSMRVILAIAVGQCVSDLNNEALSPNNRDLIPSAEWILMNNYESKLYSE